VATCSMRAGHEDAASTHSLSEKLTSHHPPLIYVHTVMFEILLATHHSLAGWSPLAGIDFKIRTIELGDKKIKLQIWCVLQPHVRGTHTHTHAHTHTHTHTHQCACFWFVAVIDALTP
jgi:hypothetical protein